MLSSYSTDPQSRVWGSLSEFLSEGPNFFQPVQIYLLPASHLPSALQLLSSWISTAHSLHSLHDARISQSRKDRDWWALTLILPFVTSVCKKYNPAPQWAAWSWLGTVGSVCHLLDGHSNSKGWTRPRCGSWYLLLSPLYRASSVDKGARRWCLQRRDESCAAVRSYWEPRANHSVET